MEFKSDTLASKLIKYHKEHENDPEYIAQQAEWRKDGYRLDIFFKD